MSQNRVNKPNQSKVQTLYSLPPVSDDERVKRAKIREQTEQDVVATLLMNGDLVWNFYEDIKISDFQNPLCKELYGICCWLIESGQALNPVTIFREVNDRSAIDGAWNLVEPMRKLLDGAMIGDGPTHAAYHIKRWRMMRANVEMANIFKRLLEDAERGGAQRDSLMDEALQAKARLDGIMSKGRGLQLDKKSSVDSALVRLMTSSSAFEMIPIGWSALDLAVGGITKPGVVIIGGPTGSGKSTLAMNMAIQAGQQGHRCTFYGLEMSVIENLARVLAYRTGLQESVVLSGAWAPEEQVKIEQAMAWLGTLPITIMDDARTLMDIKRSIQEQSSTYGTALFFVDHLKIVKAPGRDMLERIEIVTRELAELAQKIQVCIVVLAHPNKTRDKDGAASSDWLPGHICDHATQAWILHSPSGEGSTVRELSLVKGRRGLNRFTMRLHIPGRNGRFIPFEP